MAVKLGISKERVGHIFDVLQYRKFCAIGVPHMLTAEREASRVEICQQLLSHCEKGGDGFLHIIMTVDKTWVHHYEPKSKCQSMEFHHKGSPAKKKLKLRFWQRNSWLQIFRA
jgi:predicted GIY-YIG superfamily endonuclease